MTNNVTFQGNRLINNAKTNNCHIFSSSNHKLAQQHHKQQQQQQQQQIQQQYYDQYENYARPTAQSYNHNTINNINNNHANVLAYNNAHTGQGYSNNSHIANNHAYNADHAHNPSAVPIGKISDYDPITDGPRNMPNTTRPSSTLIYSSDRGMGKHTHKHT